jgi:hypothetical protein
MMNRRSLVALPAGIAAFAASQAFAQTQATASSDAAHVSTKALVKHSGLKASYKIPKNAAKQTRYLNSLSALLSLTSAQKVTAAAIFANASGTHASVKSSMKAARKAVKDAVRNNDSGAITQASTALGALKGQHVAAGAAANAAIYQLLTPDQQTKLSLYQG